MHGDEAGEESGEEERDPDGYGPGREGERVAGDASFACHCSDALRLLPCN